MFYAGKCICEGEKKKKNTEAFQLNILTWEDKVIYQVLFPVC